MSESIYSFSIVVPVFAPPAQLAGCLEAMSHLLPPPGGFEVVVVDDGSPEALDRVTESYRDKLNVTLLRQANRGPASARNAGSLAARGSLLAFTDSDCRPEPDWLTALAHRFQQTRGQMLGGHTVNSLTRNIYAVASQLILDATYALYNREPGAAHFFGAANMALPAELFHAVGRFDERQFTGSSEDRELCDRWRHCGHQMTYVPEAVVVHEHELTWSAFCRQQFSYGRGAWTYHAVRSRRDSGRLRDDTRLYGRLWHELNRLLEQQPIRRRLLLLPLLALWQVANASGFFYEAYRSQRLNGRAVAIR
jgi:glycosyltransferase involved in cell wall biosynthesis